jgi:hypothetical protein
MLLLTLRVATAPLLILGGSLVQRRYGQALGGRLIGLPLTSLPLLALMSAADGRAFAGTAATTTVGAVCAQTVWCLTYGRLAHHRQAILAAFAAAAAAFAGVSVLLYYVPLSLGWAALLATLSIVAALAAWPASAADDASRPASRSELAARMLAGSAFTVLVTGTAVALGAREAGLVGAFPVLTVVLAVATHRRDGGQAASMFLRGVVAGTGSVVAGVAAVALTLGLFGPLVAFPLAIAAALAAQLLPVNLARRPAPIAA